MSTILYVVILKCNIDFSDYCRLKLPKAFWGCYVLTWTLSVLTFALTQSLMFNQTTIRCVYFVWILNPQVSLIVEEDWLCLKHLMIALLSMHSFVKKLIRRAMCLSWWCFYRRFVCGVIWNINDYEWTLLEGCGLNCVSSYFDCHILMPYESFLL